MNIPYRITIELAIGEKGKTLQLTGETPDLRGPDGVITDCLSCAIAANALLWQSQAMAQAGQSHAQWDQAVKLLNMPTSGRPN